MEDRMNYFVPECLHDQMDNDYTIPSSSGLSMLKKNEEGTMELVWQDGQVVVSSQIKAPLVNGGGAAEREIIRLGGAEQQQQRVFMEEDEMASWLQYPIDSSSSSFDRDFYRDDPFYSAPPIAEIRPTPPPPSPPQRPEASPRLQNFAHFSRLGSRPRNEAAEKTATAVESVVVDSNVTPVLRLESMVSEAAEDGGAGVNTESGAVEAEAGGGSDVNVTSSPGNSGSSFSAGSGEERRPKGKQKARGGDENECQSEDIQEKQANGSAIAKRTRAAQVHNLSERRRRDRINDRMRALMELVPHCNKTDKASMLDDAIQYVKSLQLQVQMMSMGYGMVPMMHHGMQQYMPVYGMGMAMNQPMVPYPYMQPTPSMPNPAHLRPVFPMPAYHAPNQNSPILVTNQNEQHVQNFVDPYQQFVGPHQAQLPLPQNQGVVQLTNKPENKHSGRK